jgi:hypothetical protein
MTGDECREDAPRRATVGAGADVPRDLYRRRSRLVYEHALKVIVDVEPAIAAARALRWTVAIRTPKVAIMIGELVDVRDDDRSAFESRPPRMNEAWIRRRRGLAGGR